MISLTELQRKCDDLSTKKEMLLEEKKDKKKKIAKIKKEIRICVEAQNILMKASKVIQTRFKNQIESIITNAIQSIYDYPYTFELKFKQKSNAISAIPIVKKGDTALSPKDNMGGGILDIISIGFRIALWYIANPRSRPVLFLDEPLRFMGDLSKKAGQMLKHLSQHFSIQIIIATHDRNLMAICDRIYIISHNGVESVVKRQVKRRNKL